MSGNSKNFLWEGITANGERLHGCDNAFSEEAIQKLLSSRKIEPIFIRLAVNQKSWLWKSLFKTKIKTKHITSFTKSLANTIEANIPLAAALAFLGGDTEANTSLNELVNAMKNDVEHGLALNEVLRKYRVYFDDFYCDLIKAGEYSGKLDAILKILAAYLAKKEQQKTKIIKALFYPITVFVVAIIVTMILLLFVIPQFQEMFANFGAALPFYTVCVINFANFIKAEIIYLLLFFMAVFISFKYVIKKYKQVDEYYAKMKLKIPVFGKLLQKIILSRFTRILSIMFKSGIPIIDALSISAPACKNLVYEKAVCEVKNKVIQGNSLAGALQSDGVFPQKLVHFIALGEESGRLDDMLFEIAKSYEEEVNYLLDNLNNLLEPVIMLILGVIVGSVVIAMYLPIFRLGSVI